MKVTVTAKAGPKNLVVGAKSSGLGGEALKNFSEKTKTVELTYDVDGDGVSKLRAVNGMPLLDVKLG